MSRVIYELAFPATYFRYRDESDTRFSLKLHIKKNLKKFPFTYNTENAYQIDVMLRIYPETGGKPHLRITTLNIAEYESRPQVLIAQFSNISLPYGNYFIQATIKQNPYILLHGERSLKISVSYVGDENGGDEAYEKEQLRNILTEEANLKQSGWGNYIISWFTPTIWNLNENSRMLYADAPQEYYLSKM